MKNKFVSMNRNVMMYIMCEKMKEMRERERSVKVEGRKVATSWKFRFYDSFGFIISSAHESNNQDVETTRRCLTV
jgi:hypothetical protein